MGMPPTTGAYGDENRDPGSDSRMLSQASYHPSYHAHPQQQIKDDGPQLRSSRLPLFKHVRSILHKPPPLTTPNNPKWDEYTGELSESGKPPRVKPSNYVSPYDGAFKFSRKRSPQRPSKARKNDSPVSILNDKDVTPIDQQGAEHPDHLTARSPVSPVSEHSDDDERFEDALDESLLPEPLSPNIQREAQPGQQTSPSPSQIKRKPISRDFSSAENHPPLSAQHSPSQSSDMSPNNRNSEEVPADPPASRFNWTTYSQDASNQPTSHFSWTTYAASFFPARSSIDTMATRTVKGSPEVPRSRFSWSTVATNMTQPAHPASPPPPMPTAYSSPPVQSILSRRRPVQRTEKEEFAPVPPRARTGTTPDSATPKNSTTPTSASTIKPLQITKASTPTTSNNSPSTGKALPPPPQLTSTANLTHIETLLAQERDIVLQRRNVERAIRELEKVERASPLDVPFATVRDAKKRLAEYRTRLDEVRLEERDVGIAISRARRKEDKEGGGDGETLWVRRVTG